MKKLYYFAIISLVSLSCKKTDNLPIEGEDKTQNVALEVTKVANLELAALGKNDFVVKAKKAQDDLQEFRANTLKVAQPTDIPLTEVFFIYE